MIITAMDHTFTVREEVLKCDSLMQIFRTLNKFYDLDNCKPSGMIKGMLYPQLFKAILQTDAQQKMNAIPMKADVMAQSSMMEIFSTINKYFDLDNCFLKPIEKQAMLNHLEKALRAVSAKPRRNV